MRKHVREKPKPLNWFLSDPMYNHAICDQLGIEPDDSLDSGLSPEDMVASFHTFTDGNFVRGQVAGWAFSVFPRGDSMGQLKAFLSAAGPIVARRKSIYFVEAEQLTSGVAEINPVIESLLCWASVGEAKNCFSRLLILNSLGPDENNQHQHPIKIGEAIIFTLDSQYVVTLLQGKCRAIENKRLVDFMLHLWKFVGPFFPQSPMEPWTRQPSKRFHTDSWYRRGG